MAHYFDPLHREQIDTLRQTFTARTEWPTWLLPLNLHREHQDLPGPSCFYSSRSYRDCCERDKAEVAAASLLRSLRRFGRQRRLHRFTLGDAGLEAGQRRPLFQVDGKAGGPAQHGEQVGVGDAEGFAQQVAVLL